MDNKKTIEEDILRKINGGEGVIDDLVSFFGGYAEMKAQLNGVLEANVCPKCGKQIGPSYIDVNGCRLEDFWSHIKEYHK